ncbi:hypothetical protein MWH28_11635 [Natroniella sulfidigena]|uniref:hypothetical protein n=1 Tax=Natroniella sulfidigena TaxID=723921 RepID=UPI002009F85C|nr:hypothetical protein [Natroniella sulfidigena]MCK8818008.1 hypothetical protein [Natroniella sulfidigena]
MFKINDKFLLGIIAAILASIPLNIIEYIGHQLNFNHYTIWDIATSLYFPEIDAPYGFIIGLVTHYITIGLLGVIVVYLLYLTGTDYYLIKGLAVSLAAWILVFGIVIHTPLVTLEPITTAEYMFHLILHAIFGPLTAWVALKLAEPELLDSHAY